MGRLTICSTSLQQANEFGIVAIYPNPIGDQATIIYETTTGNNVLFKVVDILGRTYTEEILDAKIGMNVKVIDTSKFSSAMYFIVLDDGVQHSTAKLLRR